MKIRLPQELPNGVRFTAAATAVLGITLFGEPDANALQPDRSGWYHTGDGTITKSVALFEIDVFAVGHDMRCLPQRKSRRAVVSAECDKRFVWRAQRNVGKNDLREALEEAYASVDYRDRAKVRRAVSAFGTGMREGWRVTITYDASQQTTTLSPARGTSVTIQGKDFMIATWSILFANESNADVGEALISRL